jgi:uncharacterized CHY-type Zn-finger protein
LKLVSYNTLSAVSDFNSNMLEENFTICNVCKKILTIDANLKTKSCKLCGMSTRNMKKFCCEKCERIFKRFIKRKKDEQKMRMWNNG